MINPSAEIKLAIFVPNLAYGLIPQTAMTTNYLKSSSQIASAGDATKCINVTALFLIELLFRNWKQKMKSILVTLIAYESFIIRVVISHLFF